MFWELPGAKWFCHIGSGLLLSWIDLLMKRVGFCLEQMFHLTSPCSLSP